MQNTKETPTLSLVIPTYNERGNLPHLVQRLTQTLDTARVSFELVVVDDDSPDGTWRLAEEMGAVDKRVRVIRRQGERGLATAVIAGWRAARGEVLGVMDADLQYPPEQLPDLLRIITEDGADVAVASRYSRGSHLEEWPLMRKIISRGAILLAKIVLPGALSGLTDPNSGYFLMRRAVIDGVELRPIGYKILIEILARGHCRRLGEMGYPYNGRREGVSKLGSRQTVEFILHLAGLARETGEIKRMVRFFLVGFSGIFVNLGILWLLTEVLGIFYLYSGMVAAVCAMANNFICNEFWTFGDRISGRRSLAACLGRLVKFTVICSGGAVINIGVLWFLTNLLNVYYLVSALIGVALAGVWNYGLNANLTWLGSLTGEGPSSSQVKTNAGGRVLIRYKNETA